jgi:hypothetical protein
MGTLHTAALACSARQLRAPAGRQCSACRANTTRLCASHAAAQFYNLGVDDGKKFTTRVFNAEGGPLDKSKSAGFLEGEALWRSLAERQAAEALDQLHAEYRVQLDRQVCVLSVCVSFVYAVVGACVCRVGWPVEGSSMLWVRC